MPGLVSSATEHIGLQVVVAPSVCLGELGQWMGGRVEVGKLKGVGSRATQGIIRAG